MPPLRNSRLDLILICLLGLVLAAALFRPLLGDVEGRIMGQRYSEQWVSAFLNQAFLEQMVEHHSLPLSVKDMVYEEGVVSPLSLTTTLLSLPFYPFFSAVGVFNLGMMLNLVLSLLGAFLLFRRLGGGPWTALPGALLYALSPYSLDQFVYGPIECAALGWIPLALLAIERIDGSFRRYLAAGLLLALTFASSPYYSLFTVLGGVYLLLSRHETAARIRLRHVSITLCLAGVLTAPLGLAVYKTLAHPHSLTPTRLQPRDPAFHKEFLSRHVSIDLASLVLPSKRFHSRLRHHGVYLGLGALGLCGFALAWVRRSRRWLWLGSGALLFSIGGSFKIGGHLLGMGGYSLAPPAWWLCNYIPPFSQVYTPLRAMPLVYLAMGAMATLLLSRRGVSASRLQILLIGAAITAESLIGFRGQIALPSTAHDVHPIYNKIKAVAGQAGVVDLPAPRTDNELGRYLLFQLTHRKRVPYNLDMDGFGATVSSEIKDLVMGLSMDAHFPNHPPDLELDLHRYRCRGGCGGVKDLRSRGYRFLILHRTGHQRLDQKFKTCLEHCVKDPFYSDGQLRAYDMAERSQKVLKKRAH